MKKTGMLVLMLALCLALAGCSQYSRSEEKQQIARGRALMEDYLSAYVPGGKVLEVTVNTEGLVGQGTKHYLSDYVHGSYKDADGVWKFEANTETGKLYSSKHLQRLKELIGRKILDKLELGEGAEIAVLLQNGTALPHRCETFGHDDDSFEFFGDPSGWRYSKYDTIYFYDVLPIAMVDVEGFLAREDRQTLYVVRCDISLPAGMEAPDLPEDQFPLCWDGIQVEMINFITED